MSCPLRVFLPTQDIDSLPCYGKVIDVRGDDNCCFRVLARLLFNDESEWYAVKCEVVKSMEEGFSDLQANLLHAYEIFFVSYAEYFGFIHRGGEWGSLVEFTAFARRYCLSLILVDSNNQILITEGLF